MQKRSISFLQDSAFTSINIETYTNKWNILRKSRFPFCKIVHLLVSINNKSHTIINRISCKKVDLTFLKDCAFTSINNKSYTNKWNILQKSRFPFCKIVPFTSINNKSYTNKWNIFLQDFAFTSIKKVELFFARFCIISKSILKEYISLH